VGIGLAVVGGYLQFGDRAGAAAPESGKPAAIGPTLATVQPPTVAAPRTTGPIATAVPARPAKPSRISIGQLGVTAPVLAITAKQGSLTPPSNPRTVGWWSGGALPGARRGSAVITGHTVHDGGGAFDELGKLRAGAPIVVTTARGQLRYQVSSVTTYRKQALAKNAAQVFDQGLAGRLVLITCEDWNGHVYLSNVVVVARRMA
jgi:LPXTG-site transpeptidase (sortase) family protein